MFSITVTIITILIKKKKTNNSDNDEDISNGTNDNKILIITTTMVIMIVIIFRIACHLYTMIWCKDYLQKAFGRDSKAFDNFGVSFHKANLATLWP